MQASDAAAPHVPALFYVAIGLVVVGRFLANELRERRLVLSRIFLAPGIVGLLALYLLVATGGLFPTTRLLLAGEACITLGIGLAFGLAVAHFTKVRLGETPGTVYVLGSWATVGLWLAALALRLGVRFVLSPTDTDATLSANAALVVMVAAALAMVRYRVRWEARALRERGVVTSVPAA